MKVDLTKEDIKCLLEIIWCYEANAEDFEYEDLKKLKEKLKTSLEN